MHSFNYKEESFESLEKVFPQQFSNENKQKEQQLDYYFDSYSFTGIHEEMLKDEIRTKAYQNAILKNKYLFKDKIVMDIGCGTGILSLFAAQAGAKHVYAIEKANIFKVARKIIKENKFENKITILNGFVEEIQLPVEKVDIIVSEWMGYLLLFEGMFDSVKTAAEKYLKKNGMLFPNISNIYLAGINQQENQSKFFNKLICPNDDFNHQGGDISFIGKMNKLSRIVPSVCVVQRRFICTESQKIKHFNMETVTKKELDFVSEFNLKITKNGKLNGLVLWFDNEFTHGQNKIVLDTSPFKQSTHWKQAEFILERSLKVQEGDFLKGKFYMKKNNNNHRNIDMRIDYELNGKFEKIKKTEFFLFY